MDIDLNLLRVFDTLMELRSVTRAANRLGLTQSAVSHALGRLRHALGDPLFMRGAQGLQPTPRALEMAGGVREGLHRISQTLSPSPTAGQDSRRRFTLAAGTYFCTLLIPALIERARTEAPSVTFRVIPVIERLVPALDRGDIDLAFGTFVRAPGRFIVEPLFDDELVWIASVDNPEGALPFDPKRIATLPRVTVSGRLPPDAAPSSSADEGLMSSYSNVTDTLEESTTVYDSSTTIALVAATDMVALVPRRIAERASSGTVILGPGGDSRLSVSMLWHARQRADPAFEWLRGVIRTLV